MSCNVHSGQILTPLSWNMAESCSWAEFPRAPGGERNQTLRLKATEWKCLRELWLDPSFSSRTLTCSLMHTRTHQHTLPLLPLSLCVSPPSPNQVRSFDRVHSLPVPLSAPHPGRNQTHHTFLCCRPSHNSLLPPSATFQPNRSSPVRAWDEEAGPLPPWTTAQLLGVAHQRTLPAGYGEKNFSDSCLHNCLPTPRAIFSNAVNYLSRSYLWLRHASSHFSRGKVVGSSRSCEPRTMSCWPWNSICALIYQLPFTSQGQLHCTNCPKSDRESSSIVTSNQNQANSISIPLVPVVSLSWSGTINRDLYFGTRSGSSNNCTHRQTSLLKQALQSLARNCMWNFCIKNSPMRSGYLIAKLHVSSSYMW